MADPDTDPASPPSDADRAPQSPGDEPLAQEDLAARVRRQREHIEGLTGEDPLRGGIDD